MERSNSSSSNPSDKDDAQELSRLARREAEEAIKQKAEELSALACQQAKEVIQQRESYYVGRVKLVRNVLIALITLITTSGLIGGKDVLRALHDKMFPHTNPNRIAYSYQASFTLRGDDPRSHSGALAFYAMETQAVELYADFGHSPWDTSGARRVIIQLNNNAVSEPSTKGCFRDLTEDLKRYRKYRTESDSLLFPSVKNMHTLAFFLDDSQPKELTDEVYVECIILVYETK